MFIQKFYEAIKGFQFHFARRIVYGEEISKSSEPHQITKYQKMSGLETNLKSTRPRLGHYETKTETASKRPRPRPVSRPPSLPYTVHHKRLSSLCASSVIVITFGK